MWLTKNEKKVLKLLIDNAKLSDTSIANKLNISSQAIGRIRKKLEEDIIKRYTLDLDYKKLGINLILLGKMHITNEGREYTKDVEKELIEVPHNIGIFKLLEGDNCYIFLSAYKNIDHLNELIKSKHKTCKVAPFIKIDEMNNICYDNVLKYTQGPLFHKFIDDLGTKSTKIKFGSEEY